RGDGPGGVTFVEPLADERLHSAPHIDDFIPGPEAAQIDEVSPDGAQDAAAARGVVPPAPRRVERLGPAVAAQVWLEHELDVPDLTGRPRAKQTTPLQGVSVTIT